MIDQAFDHRSWHGPNLRGSIRGLTAAEAAWRSQPQRKNIHEIVLHCAYWKYTVGRRLRSEKRGSFPLKGSNWFARPIDGKIDEKCWKADVQILIDIHHNLRATIAELKPGELNRPVDSGAVTVLQLIIGIAAHDVYHAGQIQAIKRLYTDASL